MSSCANWTDMQWATHFGLSVKNVPLIRNIIENRYSAAIEKNTQTALYVVAVYRYEMTPSGFKRPILMVTSKKCFSKPHDAVKYANEQFLPALELTEYWSRELGVPAKALQLLNIKER